MSVLSCNRKKCENIMCDYYSNKHGYICRECISELINTDGRISIKKFMNSEKDNYKNEVSTCSWEENVLNEFKN
jgi:hypothetical protein